MGLVASQARLLFLTLRISDLQFNLQALSQRKMNMAAKSANIANIKANLINSNAAYGTDEKVTAEIDAKLKAIEAYEQNYIHNPEKFIDIQMKTLDTQLKAAETELESVQKIIDGNVKRSFKYGA